MPDVNTDFAARARALTPDFELQREIGRGGMGVVYLAADVKLDRPVAIKVLPEHLAGVPEIRARFLQEARTAAKLSHPNIVPIYRADELRGVVFFVMALVDGESLAERLARAGPLAPAGAARLLRDVALALDYAHHRGIVHRDVKPENILIERESDRPLVTDFGIARLAEAAPLTATGQVLGTVHYMSPEQVSGEPLDGRSDLYSLGVVGFRALTGRLPFDSETASAVLVAHVTKPAPRLAQVAPRVSSVIASVIDRCLAKEPAARYESGAALARALEEAMAKDAGGRQEITPAVLSQREAEAVWARAAELQAQTGMQTPVRTAPPPVLTPERSHPDDRRTLTSGYRFEDVRGAAAEAGIPEKYVARAARELGIAALPAVEGAEPNDAAVQVRSPRPNAWLGAPTAILIEVQVQGEVPESELDLLVDIIRQRLGEAGHVGTIGRSVSWIATTKERRLQISIAPRNGRTTIRIDERLAPLAGALFGGIMGGGGGGSAGISIGIAMKAFGSLAIGFGFWGAAIAASYGLARAIYTRKARGREETLRALAEELAAQVRASVRLLPPARNA
jgi:serine/threonine-protein kinase